jgi:hypothetical protein
MTSDLFIFLTNRIRKLPAGDGGVPCPAIKQDKPVTQIFASSALLATRSNGAY